MGRTLATWREDTRQLLGRPTVAQISDPDLEDHVLAAVRKFSADRPRIRSADYAGDGVTFDLAIPAQWVHGFSNVTSIEYPAGNRPATELDMAGVEVYPHVSSPTGIRLLWVTPATGYTARINYSVPWPVPTAVAADDLITDQDYDPVLRLAASRAAEQLAAKAASNVEPNLGPGADVDTGGASERWRSIARDLRRVYNDHVGSESLGRVAASGTVDWDTRPDWAGRRFLFRDTRR